jgi:hypothetical protein
MKFLRTLTALASATLIGSAAQAGLLYGVDNKNLYTVNKSNGAATAVGALGLAAEHIVIDLTSDGQNLYGLVQSQEPIAPGSASTVAKTRLATIDAATGAMTLGNFISGIVTTSGAARRIDTIAFDPVSRKLFGVNAGPNASLYTLDIATGVATQVGTMPAPALNEVYRSLGFDDSGRLFGGRGVVNTPNQLLSINAATGAQTVIGDTVNGLLGDLAWDADEQRLYGGGFVNRFDAAGVFAGSEAVLYSMDTTSGLATSLGSTTASPIWAGLAVLPGGAAALPEPASSTLALAALGLLWDQRRRSRNRQSGSEKR